MKKNQLFFEKNSSKKKIEVNFFKYLIASKL